MFNNIETSEFFAEKYFNFLITEYGFEKVPGYQFSYEWHWGYRKGKIEMHFCCEKDEISLPIITLKVFDNPSEKGASKYFYLIELGFPKDVKIIFERGHLSKNDEFELFIKENAEIVKRNPQILSGNLKVFTKKKKKVISTISFVSITDPDGTINTYTTQDKEKKGIINWIRNLFR